MIRKHDIHFCTSRIPTLQFVKYPWTYLHDLCTCPQGLKENLCTYFYISSICMFTKVTGTYVHIYTTNGCMFFKMTIAVCVRVAIGGWGNELSSILNALAHSINENRTLVLIHASRTTLASLSKYTPEDLFPMSSCQEVLNPREIPRTHWRRASDYTAMLESRFRDFKFHTRSSILHSAAKPPFPYHDIGAFHWYRLLATHFFHPSIKLSKALITKALSIHESTVHVDVEQTAKKIARERNGMRFTDGKGFSTHFMEALGSRLFPSRVDVGLQVRLGDACGFVSGCTNLQRPRHCIRELEPYLDALIQRGVSRGNVFVATDSSEIISSAKSMRISKSRRSSNTSKVDIP
ncbi:hypothetical protein AAMO2058_000976900 [Amorphochlora amoebiformis]